MTILLCLRRWTALQKTKKQRQCVLQHQYPYPYRGGGQGGQNQPVEFHFFLLGNPGIVIKPLKWNDEEY